MPLDFKPVEVVLKGLQQKTDSRMSVPGELERATNVEFDKMGAINKRRGYQLVDLADAVNIYGDNDVAFCHVANYKDELVVFGRSQVLAVGSKAGALNGGNTVTYRGPCHIGGVRLHHVATSQPGVGTTADGEDLFGQTFAGYDMVDCASLTANGLFYRCYIWLDRTAERHRILASCYVIQEHGQPSLVFHNIVRTEATGENPGDDIIDCPRILASNTSFVVHWLESAGAVGEARNFALHRSTMTMTAYDASIEGGWTYRSSVAVYTYGLYDAHPVVGHSTDFVVARMTGAAEVTVERFNGLTWASTAWTATPALTLAPRILGVYAHESDNDVVFSYSPGPAGISLNTSRLNATTGAGLASAVTFANLAVELSDMIPTNVGHVRVRADTVAVVCEAASDAWFDQVVNTGVNAAAGGLHYLGYRLVNSTTAGTTGNEHWCPNLNMVSRPWAYADGLATDGTSTDLFCLVSYKTLGRGSGFNETWGEAHYFVVNLDQLEWSADDGTVLPRVMAHVGTSGVPDARPAGRTTANTLGTLDVQGTCPSKRMNHLCSVSGCASSEAKSRTIGALIFAGVQAVNTEDSGTTREVTHLVPRDAGVVGIKFQIEDPWLMWRDPSDGTQPTANFSQPYALTQFPTVEVGRQLFVGGGCPSVYDGHKQVDCGFPWRPEIVGHTFTNSGEPLQNNIANGATHLWYAVATCRDASGTVHRSGPSNVYWATNSSGGARRADFYIRCLNVSSKGNRRHFPLGADVKVELYRTTGGTINADDEFEDADGIVRVNTAAGLTFYRVFGQQNTGGTGGNINRPKDIPTADPLLPVVNWPANLVQDAVADVELIYQGIGPYTLTSTGFVELLPQTPPAMSPIAYWTNRIWGVSQEDPSILYYSDEILPELGGEYEVAPEFSDSNTFRLGAIGEVTAMQPQGNQLIIFTRSAIYALQGQGNDGTGQGATLSIVTLAEGTGCVEARSVVLTPIGVFFQSWKGYYVLAGAELDYVSAGSAVETLVREAGNVRAATLMESFPVIKIVCDGPYGPPATPRVLHYDYEKRLWSRHDIPLVSSTARLNQTASGCAWRGSTGAQCHVVLHQGNLHVQRNDVDGSAYTDDGIAGAPQGIPIDIQTKWISFAGLHGWERTSEIHVLTTRNSAEDIHVDLEYDREGSFNGTTIPLTTYDWTNPAPADLVCRPEHQRIRANRIRIYEDADITAANTVTVHAITFLVGFKRGLSRVAESQRGT